MTSAWSQSTIDLPSMMGSDSEDKVALVTGIPQSKDTSPSPPTRVEKFFAAALYAVSSFLVIFVNKWVLSTYAFPSFMVLAAVQFLSTSIILGFLCLIGKIDIPPLSRSIFLEVIPITCMFLGNVLTGLGSTQALNLPMFTALRRFSILFTMIGEMIVLKKEVPTPVLYSVLGMVGGALIAAINDLTFDLTGYVMIFLNDLFTAFNGIYMKKATLSGQCTKMGILYYNSLFSFIAVVLIFGLQIYEITSFGNLGKEKSGEEIKNMAIDTSDIIASIHFEGWKDPAFLFLFALAALMGSILNYAIFLCTTTNSALTTTVIGCLKNVFTTYIGMIFMPNYIFSWLNFIGLNVSIFGSLYYTYIILYLRGEIR